MRRHHPSRNPCPNRPGKTLVLFALLLPLLLGMVGLAMDSGLLLATYRQTQNAADAAATAAAYDLYNGKTAAVAKATGATYVQTYNNMSGATVTINIGPSTGPNSGDATYAEAIVSYNYNTSFIQFLGVSKTQTVTARAVAGGPLSSPVEGVITLEQTPPGGAGGADLTVSGGGSLTVDGPVIDNATDGHQALDISGSNSRVYATKVSVSGGSDATASAIQNYPSGGGASPLTDEYRGQLRRSVREPGGPDNEQRRRQHQLWDSPSGSTLSAVWYHLNSYTVQHRRHGELAQSGPLHGDHRLGRR